MPKWTLVSCALALATAPLFAQEIPEHGRLEFEGTWFGDFILTSADKRISHDKAVLLVKQDGSAITGSIGATVDQQTAFRDGHVDSGSMRFHLDVPGGMDFHLHFDGGHLKGEAIGKSASAKVDLQRAPGLLPHSELTQEITNADRKLFEAFSTCDVARYGSFLDKDLEFFQDHTGKTGYEENLHAIRDRCAEGIQLRRELVEDSLVVNAVPGYGAIEAGTQRFYSRQSDGAERVDATAQFTCIWSKQSGSWKLVRVISYNHH